VVCTHVVIVLLCYFCILLPNPLQRFSINSSSSVYFMYTAISYYILCSLYIRRGGEIHCRMTGSRCFSADLEQGGLGLNFCSLNFRILTWHTNYTKISTIQKFPLYSILLCMCIEQVQECQHHHSVILNTCQLALRWKSKSDYGVCFTCTAL